MTEAKITILKLILENKPDLFGKVTHECSVETKVNKWKKIAKEAQELGIMDSSKDWRFLRDPIWQNWRKCAVKKAEKRKKTGLGKRLDESDKLVFKILGRDSDGEPLSSSNLLAKRFKLDTSEQILEMKLNILEKENYLKELEIFQKEQELALPPSTFTKHLYNIIHDDQEYQEVHETEECQEIKENSEELYTLDVN